MSTLPEGPLPGYEEVRQHYPEEMEHLEQKIGLYDNETDMEQLFVDSKIPEILVEADHSTFEEITEEYGQSLVLDLIDYGLLDHKLDEIQSTEEGEEYLQILEKLESENSPEYDNLWISKAEVEEKFERYETDTETIRNVFQGNDTPEEKINWDDLPETPKDLSNDPWWVTKKKESNTTGPDWVVD